MAKKRINKEALFMVTSFVLCLGFTSFICMAFPALKISQSIAGITATTKVEGLIAVIGGKIDEDYIKKDTKDLKGKAKVIQIAINRTVDRVHQSMESFIHNMNPPIKSNI